MLAALSSNVYFSWNGFIKPESHLSTGLVRYEFPNAYKIRRSEIVPPLYGQCYSLTVSRRDKSKNQNRSGLIAVDTKYFGPIPKILAMVSTAVRFQV